MTTASGVQLTDIHTLDSEPENSDDIDLKARLEAKISSMKSSIEVNTKAIEMNAKANAKATEVNAKSIEANDKSIEGKLSNEEFESFKSTTETTHLHLLKAFKKSTQISKCCKVRNIGTYL